MRIRHAIGVLIVVALTGCATVSRAPPPPPPPAPAPDDTGTASFGIARGFAGPDTYLAPAPTALVLIDGAAPYERKWQLCESFVRMPRASDARSSSDVDLNLIVTRMPLSIADLEPASREHCGYLMTHYDHARAQRIIAQLGLAGRVGPVLVAIFPDGTARGETPFLVVDASDLPAGEIPAAVEAWQAAMLRASARLHEDGDFDGRPLSPAVRWTGSSGSPKACDWAGKTVEVVGPVLAEVLKETFTSNPLVKIFLSTIRRAAAEGAAETVRLEGDSVFKDLGDGTRALCGRVLAARAG